MNGFCIDIQTYCEKAFKKQLKIKFLIRDSPLGVTLTYTSIDHFLIKDIIEIAKVWFIYSTQEFNFFTFHSLQTKLIYFMKVLLRTHDFQIESSNYNCDIYREGDKFEVFYNYDHTVSHFFIIKLGLAM